MRLFDVHTHMQDSRFDHSLEDVIERANRAGVKKIISCGVHEGDWEKLTAISKKYPFIIPAYGLHPWFVSSRTTHFLFDLERIISQTDASVGEIGLDRLVQASDPDEQKNIFLQQLRLSKKYKRPVSLHCRKAWGLMADILKAEGGLPFGGVIHSYSGSKDMVKIFEAMGAYISFSGSVTRPDNKKTRAAVKVVSEERLLIETDSPDILPTCVCEGLNEPGYLKHILSEVAFLRNVDKSNIAAKIYENSERLFLQKSNTNRYL